MTHHRVLTVTALSGCSWFDVVLTILATAGVCLHRCLYVKCLWPHL